MTNYPLTNCSVWNYPSSGIGQELSLQLAQEGHLVEVTGRRIQPLEDIRRLYPQQIICAQLNNTHSEKLAECLDQLKAQLKGLDLLIVSPGIGHFNKSLSFAIEKETLALNIIAFCQICLWALETFDLQTVGHLVAITAIAGLTSSPLAPAYNVSKAFQINYLNALRRAVRKKKLAITITDVRPGLVNTAMAKGDGLFWVAPIEKAARQIRDAIRRRKDVVYITRRWALLGFFIRFLPS